MTSNWHSNHGSTSVNSNEQVFPVQTCVCTNLFSSFSSFFHVTSHSSTIDEWFIHIHKYTSYDLNESIVNIQGGPLKLFN